MFNISISVNFEQMTSIYAEPMYPHPPVTNILLNGYFIFLNYLKNLLVLGHQDLFWTRNIF